MSHVPSSKDRTRTTASFAARYSLTFCPTVFSKLSQVTPQVRESAFRNPGNLCLKNPEPVKNFSLRNPECRGTQRKMLRKRPKNNNKAWIKFSEAMSSILGDCWEKVICSSLPARLTDEFPASNLTYWDVSGQLGVVRGQNSALQLGGEGGRA